MPTRNIKRQPFILGTVLLLLSCGGGGPVLAQFCAVDPLIPPCCPTPCPILDPTRIPDLLADVTNLQQTVGAETQIVRSMTQLGQAIGDTKAAMTALSQYLSSFPSTISSERTAIQANLPINPVAALVSLRQSLFEPASGGQGSATQMTARAANRAVAAQQEQVGSFAASLMKSRSLPSGPLLHDQLAAVASGSNQLHVDLVVNSTSRLALYQDVGSLHQLLAAWVSLRSSAASLTHSEISGGTVSQPSVAPEGVGQSAITSQAEQSTVDQMIALHDSRVSAQMLLPVYPALQQTIASSSLADQFVGDAQRTLQKSLSTFGAGSDTALSQVEKALLSADASGWLDSGKDAQAHRAAVQVLAGMAVNGSISPDSAGDDDLIKAMSAWLDASKQSRYWGQLAQDAQTSIANLDQRLGVLSDRAGVDVTGSAAAAAEAALLSKLRHDPSASQWQGLLAAASHDRGAQSVLLRMAAQ